MTKPFADLRVVELAGSHAGAFSAKMFADYGAQVVKIVPSNGDPLLHHGELLPSHPFGDYEVGSIWAFCNTSKSVYAAEPASEKTRELIAGADVVIESSAPDPLEPVTLETDAPQLIRVLISPFGLDGPWAGRRSNVFTDDAASGHMYLNGVPDRYPFRRHGRHTEYSGGMYGFIGAMAALIARESTGRGQTVEVAHIEAMVAMHQHTTTMWTHAGHVLRREGNAQPGMWHPAGVYECADGFVFLGHATAAKLEPFLHAAGVGHILDDPRLATNESRGLNKAAFDEALRPWLMSHTSAEICELGEATFSPLGPVWDTHEFLADPHMIAREFFVPLDASHGDELIPRGPFRIGDDLAGANPLPPRWIEARELEGWESPKRAAVRGSALQDGPLTGLRVLDLTRVWAGPIAGRLLGDLGADVIHIESPWNRGPLEAPDNLAELTHLYPDNELGERHWNRNGGFNKLARNKRGVSIDLSSSPGLELFRELLSFSDVVLENFSPRVFPQWGLDWESLRRLNPSIIHTSMPGYGAQGPGANRVALGPVIEAATGMTMMSGYADGIPFRSGVAWPDPVSGMSAVAGTLVALWRRMSQGGDGQRVETAMIESMGTFAGDELLSAQIVGQPPPRRGNREQGVAPQGVYRCLGDDRWLAISVTSDVEWTALCGVAELPDDWLDWALWEREARHDEIDAALNIWCRAITPSDAATRLQRAGVIAAGLADGRDLLESDHLAARSFWAEVSSTDVGALRYPGCPIRLSDTPATYRRGAPGLGEHNLEVLTEYLGKIEAEVAALREDGVLADRPPSMEELLRPRI
ncbi:MAG: CoA transferase [Chloroflexi bacterium]|nr:CoA transferase [Chloroflexota bacterium]MYF22119.1 CoA transferase [Chloroflexota bacterium]